MELDLYYYPTRDVFPLPTTQYPHHLYTGEQMSLAGEIKVKVRYGKQRSHLALFVVEGDGPSLMGRDGLKEITLDWKSKEGAGNTPEIS